MNVEQIWSMPYPDFVTFIEQHNTPPGGRSTLDWWIEAAGIQRDSHVLDLACNTGYSARGIAQRTGCSAAGIDLSEVAIASARESAQAPEFGNRLAFSIGDATTLPWAAGEFSHAVAGCCFGFIEQRERALDETARVLKAGGRLCVSALAYVETPPALVFDQLEQCLGFRPDAGQTLPYWRDFFARRFDVEAAWIERLPVHREEQLRDAAVAHLIQRAERFAPLTQVEREAALLRLFRDRMVFNENRRYQTCCRWVLRKRAAN